MIGEKSFIQLYSSYLALFAFATVVFPPSVGPGVLIMMGFMVAGIVRKELVFKFSWIAGLMTALYVAYIIGTMYSDHIDAALVTLEHKLSLLLFPVILSFRPKSDEYYLPRVLGGLTMGVIVVGIFGLVNSLHCYVNGGSGCFLTVKVSPIHHPSYFTVYLIFSMIGSWIGVRRGWKYYNYKWVIPFLLFGLMLHVLSLSLAGILYLILVIGGVIVFFVHKKWGKLGAVGITLAVIVSAYLTVNYVPRIEGEWNNAKWFAEEYFSDPESFLEKYEYPMPGSAQRLILWTVAVDIIKDHPMGLGTGDLNQEIEHRLLDMGKPKFAERHLNPHNQFLQIGGELGIIGIAVFLLMILISVIKGFRERGWLLLLLSGALAFNCLFESMLQRQSGVVFFAFWICLLMFKPSESVK